jgi:signal transduction histidine kinase
MKYAGLSLTKFVLRNTSSDKVKVAYKSVKDISGGKAANHSDNIFVQADRDRIMQVISNLLDNAIKFTPQGFVSVVISGPMEYKEDQGKHNEKQAVVSVEDTGSGIDPEIFPKFTSKSFSGTGLGLYISKSIIEAHGGKIWAKNNTSQGKSGATFCFSLPVAT